MQAELNSQCGKSMIGGQKEPTHAIREICTFSMTALLLEVHARRATLLHHVHDDHHVGIKVSKVIYSLFLASDVNC